MPRYMIVGDYQGIRRIDGETPKMWTCDIGAYRWKKRQSDKVFYTFEDAKEELMAELEERRLATLDVTQEHVDSRPLGHFFEYDVYAERMARRILMKERGLL